ncbi:MAG: FxsA family protein [Paracoccaceae bacterium]
MPILLFFVALPLIEIALMVAIGSQIGVLATLLLVILSAVLGMSVLRGQSERARGLMRGGMRVSPAMFMAQGAFRVVGGLLLILPGFLTDAIGLVLLVPLVQKLLLAWIAARATVTTVQRWDREDIVEGEFTVDDGPGAQTGEPRQIDGWRRH